MASPSFTIMYPYRGRTNLYHFDLYRLEEPEEFYQAGLDEYIGGDGIALVEWPDHADILPSPRIDVTIERGTGDDDRYIHLEFTGMEDRRVQIAQALSAWEA